MAVEIYVGTRRSGSDQVWKNGIDGANPVQVTKSGGFEALESLASREVASLHEIGGGPGLWRMPRAGGGEELLMRDVITGTRVGSCTPIS